MKTMQYHCIEEQESRGQELGEFCLTKSPNQWKQGCPSWLLRGTEATCSIGSCQVCLRGRCSSEVSSTNFSSLETLQATDPTFQ